MLPKAGITRKHKSSRDSFSSFGNEAEALSFADTGELAADPEDAAILVSLWRQITFFYLGLCF